LGVLGAQTQTTDENGVLEGTGDEPSEAPVPTQSILSYTVSPDMPRYIRIPSIGVFSRVKQLGITREGAVDAPANINDAGWFNGSAKPGSAIGSSLIVAHVSGWTAPGAFKKINQLKPGMRFEIEKGDGEKLVYEVVRGESIPVDQVNMESILNPVEGEQHDLKLMTCSGRFNRQTDHYEERYVIFAKILR
jgi:sortase (surface protein transpeptidase)